MTPLRTTTKPFIQLPGSNDPVRTPSATISPTGEKGCRSKKPPLHPATAPSAFIAWATRAYLLVSAGGGFWATHHGEIGGGKKTRGPQSGAAPTGGGGCPHRRAAGVSSGR